MLTIIIRAIVIYTVLTVMLRLMDKRQIGELQISELITTLLLSELAANPIENPDQPLLYFIIPILLIVALELFISDLKNRVPLLKKVFESPPAVLVRYGIPDQAEMQRMRVSLEELLSALRLEGVTDISDVAYAILEQNGKLSVTPRAEQKPVTLSDLSLSATERGISHALIIDGEIIKEECAFCNKDEEWLYRTAHRYGCTLKDVFLLALDDAGGILCLKKNQKGKSEELSV